MADKPARQSNKLQSAVKTSVTQLIRPAPKAAATPPPTPPSLPGPAAVSNNSRPRPWTAGRITLVIVGLILAALIAFGVGLYSFGWRGSAAQRVINVLPYPVALVNARLIRFSTYQADFNTLKYFYAKQAELNSSLFTMPDDQSIRGQLIDKLIRDALTGQLARQYDINVTSTEIDAELQKIIDQTGNQADVEANIRELYDWDLNTFRDKVVKPYLVRSRLQEKLMSDTAVNGEALKRAQAILDQVKAGAETFETIAQNSSEDETTATKGGDLGYFGPNELVESFETAVRELEVGAVSELVQTPYGFHIIKLEDKTTDPEGQPSYRARHILIRTKDLDAWIGEKLQAVSVWLFAPGFNWDKSAGEVVAPADSADPAALGNANASTNANSR